MTEERLYYPPQVDMENGVMKSLSYEKSHQRR